MRYLLKAVNAKRDVVALELDAADEAASRDAARRQGLSAIAIRGLGLGRFGGLPRRTAFRPALFSIELLALLDAG